MTATVHTLRPEHAKQVSPDSPTGKILRGLEDMALSTIGEQLRVMFESADDLLFEMADKTKNGTEQRLFLDTMRIVRLERPRILKAFQDALHQAFGRSDQAVEETKVNLDDLESWSLQDSTELEEKIAVSNMDAKAESLYASQLYELEQRMAQLADYTEGAVSSKALSPVRILESFQRSMRGLEIDFPIKLVLYKLFDRVVVTNLGRVFSGANQLLAEHGVEARKPRPKDKPKPAAGGYAGGAAPASASSGAAMPGGAAAASGAEGFVAPAPFQTMAGSLHGDYLAQAMRPYLPGGTAPMPAGSPPAGYVAAYVPATSPYAAGTPAPQGQPGYQGQPGGAMAAPPAGAAPSYSNADLAGEMLQVMDAVGRGRPISSWMPAQNLTLVSRMFDDFYADPRLPEAARPVLSQLQFPAMKVALQDPTFFSNPHHPVRTLVHDVFDAATSVRNTHAADFKHLEQLIRDLMQRFDPDPAKLRQAARTTHVVTEDEAERFLTQQQERLEEQRRQIKEKVRRIVAQELRLHIGGRHLSKPVMSLLLSGFAPLLATQYLRGGAEGAGWQQALALLDQLLESLDPAAQSAPSRDEDRSAVTAGISQGLRSIGLAAEKVERLLKGLDDEYRRMAEPAPAPAATPATTATTVLQAAAGPAAPAPRADAAVPGEGERALPLLLRPGEWFKVWDSAAHHCRWLKLTSFHPAIDALVFEDFGAENFLKIRVSAFLQDLAAARSAPVDPDPATQKLIKLLPPPAAEAPAESPVWYKANPMSHH